MANPYRGQIDLRIEGEDDEAKVYKLHYDGNALVELEEVMGLPINVILRDKIELMDGFKFRRAALYYGLQRDPRGKKLTLRECGEIVSSPQGRDIHYTCLRGVFLAMGMDVEKEQKKLEKEQKELDAEAEGKKPAKKKKAEGRDNDPLGPAA